MQRYFVHLQNKTFTSKDAVKLLTRARAVVDPEVIVRDSRVSRKYIEFDTSLPDSMNVDEMVERLVTISPLASCELVVEVHVEKEVAIKHAIDLFNEEKYWGTHEALELVWKKTHIGKERDLINGIILVAAALVHDEKDEPQICLSILQRALKKFDDSKGTYHGIDIDRMKSLILKMTSTRKIERFTI